MEESISIKEYTDARFDAVNKHIDSILVERARAEDRAIAVLEGRLGKMNEIREQLTQQYAEFNTQMNKYITRDEYNGKHDAVLVDLRKVEEMFKQYTSLVEFQNVRAELKMLVEWRANMAGRLWALGIGLALFQVLLTAFRWSALGH